MSSSLSRSVLYVDPSYTGTGLFFLDRAAQRMEFGLVAPGGKTMRSYENYFATALIVVHEFFLHLQSWKPSVLKLEVPPPIGQTSAGLTGLSYLLLAEALRVRGLVGYPERVELINPYFIARQQKKYFSLLSSRTAIAREFLSLQKSMVRGVSTRHEELLEDNDVATAYLFYVFEKIAEGAKPFPVLPENTSSFYTTFPTASPSTVNATITHSSTNQGGRRPKPAPHF